MPSYRRKCSRRVGLRIAAFGLAAVCGGISIARSAEDTPSKTAPEKNKKDKAVKEAAGKWKALFNGRSLNGWKVTDFGGQGKVDVKNEELILGVGNDLTGVTIDQPIPRINYEVELEAQRVDGTDFFCGLTFPVKKDCCSLILGGWGGGVCGLSSIDGFDAHENSTTSYREFKNGRWYSVRLRVTDSKIEAWLDKEQIVNQELGDHTISVRIEVEDSKPFGLASYQTKAALRNLRLRSLQPAAAKP